VRRRDLFIGPSDSGRPERRGTIAGTLTNAAGASFPGARIVMDEVPEVRSDRNGQFMIRDVPIGTRQLQVLSIGMAPVVMTVDVFAGDTSVVAAQLHSVITLDVVRVIGSATQRRLIQDLENRRHRGGGYMLDSTQIGGHGTMMSVFTTVPTVQIQRIGNAGRFFVLLPQGNRKCVAALWIDGVQQMTGREADVAYDQLLDIHPDEIAAVEVYPHATTVPMELAGTDPTCGVVALWTKSKLSR
jgi:sirohydrochlorin ferrochelatase